MSKLKKNILAGRVNFLVILIYFFFINISNLAIEAEEIENSEGQFIEIKILDKVSSKNKRAQSEKY